MVHSQNIPQNWVQILEALNENHVDLLDVNRTFQELEPITPVLSCSKSFTVQDVDLDEFDWAGIKFADFDFNARSLVANGVKPAAFDSKEFYKSVEAIISNGYFWEADDEDYSPSPEFRMSLGLQPKTKAQFEKSDVNKMLRQFNRLPNNELDVLSSEDTIFESNYKVVSNFEINVPLKVYSEDEDWVIKANLPDIVFNNTSSGEDVFPEQLNFKSVLALLPDRINTRQLQPSFVNGQFRLELPKREELRSSRVK